MAPTPAPPAERRSRPLLVAFLTVLLDLVGFGIIIPIQPYYAEHFDASPTLVTLLGASYSFMQFLFAPMWGRLSDRIGRRPVVLSSISMGVAGYVLFGFAQSLPMLFAARMLAGFGAANIGAVQSIVADTTSGADRAKGMGLIGAAFGLGFTIGPALGGALGQISLEAPAFGAAGLGLLNLFLAFRLLPETRRHGGAPSHAARKVFSLRDLAATARIPNGGRLLAIVFLSVTGMALMEQALGLFIERVYLDPATHPLGSPAAHTHAAGLTAWVLTAVGITSLVVQGGLIGRLSVRFGERTLMRAGALIMGVALALIPVVGAGPFALLVGVGALLAIGSSVLNPSLTAFLSRSVSREVQGATLGLSQSLGALGRTVGPAASGAIFELGRDLPFAVAAAFLVLAFAFALGLRPLAEAHD